MTAALAAVFLHERLKASRVIGLALGFAGVVSVMAEHVGARQPGAWAGYGALLVAALAWSLATIYYRARPLRTPIIWNLALQLWMGGLVLLPISIPVDHLAWRMSWPLVGSVLYLGVVGLAFSYFLWLWLIQRGELSRLVAYLFMVPLMATLIAIAALGERPVPLTVLGMCLTLAGIYIVNRPEPEAAPAAGALREAVT